MSNSALLGWVVGFVIVVVLGWLWITSGDVSVTDIPEETPTTQEQPTSSENTPVDGVQVMPTSVGTSTKD